MSTREQLMASDMSAVFADWDKVSLTLKNGSSVDALSVSSSDAKILKWGGATLTGSSRALLILQKDLDDGSLIVNDRVHLESKKWVVAGLDSSVINDCMAVTLNPVE